MDRGAGTDSHEHLSDSSRARTGARRLDHAADVLSVEETDRIDLSSGSVSKQLTMSEQGLDISEGVPSIVPRPEDSANKVPQHADASAIPDAEMPEPQAMDVGVVPDPTVGNASTAHVATGKGIEQYADSAARKRSCVLC